MLTTNAWYHYVRATDPTLIPRTQYSSWGLRPSPTSNTAAEAPVATAPGPAPSGTSPKGSVDVEGTKQDPKIMTLWGTSAWVWYAVAGAVVALGVVLAIYNGRKKGGHA